MNEAAFKSTLRRLCSLIDRIGSSFNGKAEADIGYVKITYLTLLERIERNVYAINTLLEHEFNYIQENRHPIFLLFRAIIGDCLVGLYLYPFKDDEKSFKNETGVISLSYINFSEFLRRNEPHFPFSNKAYEGKTAEQLEIIAQQSLKDFREANKEFYEESNGSLHLLKPEALRNGSKPELFRCKNVRDIQKNNFNEKFSLDLLYATLLGKAKESGSDELLHSAYSYLLYRALSQYEHFTLELSRHILNTDKEFELALLDKCLKQTILHLQCFLIILEVHRNLHSEFESIAKDFADQ